jgi:hypothetical protein
LQLTQRSLVIEKEMKSALDHLCSSFADVVAGNGEFIHTRRLHPHSVSAGHCRGADSDHSRS